jgi:DNA repair exonuclease SbcCD nuclease subunit
MKIALISDLHFGTNKNNDIFLNSQINYFKNEFVPSLIDNNIDTIFILGDIFDDRNNINSKIKHEVFNLFETTLKDFNIYIIAGNHDCYLKNSNSITSVKFLKKFENIHIIEDMEIVTINNKNILCVSWQSNNNEFKEKLPSYKNVDYCFGHFELNGFPINKFRICDFGIDSTIFGNISKVFSGHFHTRSNINNITYIGCPYHLNRNDKNDNKGYCILDLESTEYDFVDSQNTIKYIEIDYPNLPENLISNNIIDINVNCDDSFNEKEFDKYKLKIEKLNPIKIHPKIIKNIKTDVDMDFKSGSILDLVTEYLNMRDDLDNKDKVFENLEELFNNVNGDL